MAGVVLTGVLVALATLQYRWLGEVSEAERGRMRESLRVRAADFTQDFDRELTRIYIAFHFDPDALDRDPGSSMGAALDKAQASAAVPAARAAGREVLRRRRYVRVSRLDRATRPAVAGDLCLGRRFSRRRAERGCVCRLVRSADGRDGAADGNRSRRAASLVGDDHGSGRD